MLVEPIAVWAMRVDRHVKGRGWFDTFAAYRHFFGQALRWASDGPWLVVPSVKYHCRAAKRPSGSRRYSFTTTPLLRLGEACGNRRCPWKRTSARPWPASERATQQSKIGEWLKGGPGLIHRAAPGKVRVGLKIQHTL